MDAAGTQKASSYHHVMGTSTAQYTGDIAPNAVAGAYPTGADDVFCVSCHTDHNYFNTAKGSNLRVDVTSGGDQTTNTDFMASGTNGICVTCHATQRTKDTANQASSASSSTADDTTATQIISGTRYQASSHQYEVTATFGATTSDRFGANCSKCHNDEQAKSFQTSTAKIGTHFSRDRDILSSLGATVTDWYREEECFGCHTGAVAGTDYYGAKAMSKNMKSTERVFGFASSHPLDKMTAGRRAGLHLRRDAHRGDLRLRLHDHVGDVELA